jgi:hypothetical protein
MTQASQPVRGRILPPKEIPAEELIRRKEKRRALAARCRVVFERLRPQLIEEYYNWFIAIDPDNESYLIDSTLIGLTEQIKSFYPGTEVKLTIFQLNETGTCGRI